MSLRPLVHVDNILNQLQTRYRRASDVKFYDELMEEWNEQNSH